MNTAIQQNAVYGSVDTAVTTAPLSASAVSWSAILAGAAAAAALSLILLILGTGLGLSSVSPWVSNGVSAGTFGISTIIWITFTQLIAAGMGGYLAGRLRTKWLEVHGDEIYFRDTAHGFLTWAIASLATAVLLSSVISSIVHGGVQAAASVTGGLASALVATASGTVGAQMATSETGSDDMSYFLDGLFRRDMSAAATPLVGEQSAAPSPQATSASMAEVSRIFINAIHANAMPAADVSYVGQMIAQHTNLTQQEAEARVTESFTRVQAALAKAETAARDAADKARKTSAYAAIWLFLSLLIGAFVASFAATVGGRQRDA